MIFNKNKNGQIHIKQKKKTTNTKKKKNNNNNNLRKTHS